MHIKAKNLTPKRVFSKLRNRSLRSLKLFDYYTRPNKKHFIIYKSTSGLEDDANNIHESWRIVGNHIFNSTNKEKTRIMKQGDLFNIEQDGEEIQNDHSNESTAVQ